MAKSVSSITLKMHKTTKTQRDQGGTISQHFNQNGRSFHMQQYVNETFVTQITGALPLQIFEQFWHLSF